MLRRRKLGEVAPTVLNLGCTIRCTILRHPTSHLITSPAVASGHFATASTTHTLRYLRLTKSRERPCLPPAASRHGNFEHNSTTNADITPDSTPSNTTSRQRAATQVFGKCEVQEQCIKCSSGYYNVLSAVSLRHLAITRTPAHPAALPT